jgi:hypothetical protein
MVVVEAVVLVVVGTHLLVQLVQCKIVHHLGSWLFSIPTVMVVGVSMVMGVGVVMGVGMVVVKKIASSGLQWGTRRVVEIVVVTKNAVVVVFGRLIRRLIVY